MRGTRRVRLTAQCGGAASTGCSTFSLSSIGTDVPFGSETWPGKLKAPRSSTYEIVKRHWPRRRSSRSRLDGPHLLRQGALFLRCRLSPRTRSRPQRPGRGRPVGAETGETSQFCMLHENKYTVVHMRAGTRPFRISSDIGTQVPLPWTASGRLLLSHLQRRRHPKDRPPGGSGPARWKSDRDRGVHRRGRGGRPTRILHHIRAGRRYTHCIAAPALDQRGHAAATLCFVVPVDTAPERLDELRVVLVESGRSRR